MSKNEQVEQFMSTLTATLTQAIHEHRALVYAMFGIPEPVTHSLNRAVTQLTQLAAAPERLKLRTIRVRRGRKTTGGLLRYVYHHRAGYWARYTYTGDGYAVEIFSEGSRLRVGACTDNLLAAMREAERLFIDYCSATLE